MQMQVTKKVLAIDFLNLVVSGNVHKAFQKHVSENFRHHNPYFEGGADALLKAMVEDATMNPNKSLEVKQVIEENDSVMVYSHVKQNQEDPGWAIIHIFRYEEDKIVELWDKVNPSQNN